MSTFDQFLTEWLTNPPKRVADPLLAGDHPFQCVSLIKQGLAEIDGLNMSNSWWGNALDYWTKTNPAILSKRDRLETQDVVRGDVVILKTAGHTDYVGEGHIVWASGNQNSIQFEAVEQDGQTGSGNGTGGDMIRTRWINKSRIAGVLRQKPAAADPPPPAIPYTIVLTDPKQMKAAPAHNKWNLRYQTFEEVRDNPIGTSDGNTVFTARAILIHRDGYSYYLEDPNVPEGWNTLDCEDYISPAPPVPYAPPAAPVPVTKAEVYDLVTSVPYFATASDAFHNKQSLGSLSATSYFVFSKDIGMLNLTSNNQKDLQHWINPALNVVEAPKQVITVQTVADIAKAPVTPTTSDPKAWYDRIYWLNSSMLPEYFLPTHKVEFADLSGTRPESYFLPEAQPVKVYGTVTNPSTNTKYYLLKLPSDTEFQYRFAVPMVDPTTSKAQMLKQAVKAVRNRDHVRVIMSEAEELGLKFIDAIIPKWYRKNNNKKDS